MTPIGHTLTGLSIGYLVTPRDFSPKQKLFSLGVFCILASAPDLPLPYWGHERYDISHSLFSTTVGVTMGVLLVLWKVKGRLPITTAMIIGGAITWYSHLLLDAMYSWGVGLPIGWPFGMIRFAVPVPWLHTGNKYDVFSLHNVKVGLMEILTFGPLLLLSLILKHYWPLGSQAVADVHSATD